MGEAEGQFYIAMEFVAGKPLSALIPPEGLPAETLERALEQRLSWMVFLKVDPRLSRLRGEARFDALVRRVGIPGD